ncbi:16S rRNA (guanine(527)-N(7))-methyltransferase RsmG [Tumidithrix helvetica PCC 7403]|uniref:16S rRNA (guanine(527)-N(7))-methyltransferase RsmG n=1 Tax=Tumidithrix helvetica TaxID=3457545 RepID=UPI003C922FF0
MFSEFSHLWQTTLNWQPTNAQELQFQQLYDLVIEGNKIQNLTRITDRQDFWEKHLWDSLRGVMPYFGQENLQAIDIGTGAGFPGLPCAIAQPTWQITLLDSRQKKTAFVKQVIEKIQLVNGVTLAGRSEEIGRIQVQRQKYDLALIRAVGSAELCTQYALPFLKSGGQAVLYRGQWSDKEQEELTKACETIGAEIVKVETFFTPLTASARHCIYLAPYFSTSV